MIAPHPFVRALVVGPYLQSSLASSSPDGQGCRRSPKGRLEEAVGLACAIDLHVVGTEVIVLRAPRPSTYLGKGRVTALAERVEVEEIALVMFDCTLTPVQQRNLEKALKTKVIDRTGLILEIFGRRAHTREGAMQVELAHLAYQKSRLVRSWTHLERQRGGFGFLGGPGETQIETDRRLIQERITKLEQGLTGVKRTRGLHRRSRLEVPFPLIALVGYTNAGKSTLFNCLTHSDVMAKDMLFATLDPTLRRIRLPSGAAAILSDTVGFISDLPTLLISAFRATLEEVRCADLVLHICDVSHLDTWAQREDVETILHDLDVNCSDSLRFLEVWNKIDLLPKEERARLSQLASNMPQEKRPLLLSAQKGEGIDALLKAMEIRLMRDRVRVIFHIPPQAGEALAWVHAHGEVLDRRQDEVGKIHLVARLEAVHLARFYRKFPDISVHEKRNDSID